MSGCVAGNIRSTSDAMNIEVGVSGKSHVVASLLVAGRVVPKLWPKLQSVNSGSGADVS